MSGAISGTRPEFKRDPTTRDVPLNRLIIYVPDKNVKDAAAILQQEIVDRKDMELLGIDYSAQGLRNLEKKGLFPKRRYLSPTRPVWLTPEVKDWLRVKVDQGGIRKPIGGGRRPLSSYRKKEKKGAADAKAK
jgi:predicted DNA-binding transcriptional regulator AlpA